MTNWVQVACINEIPINKLKNFTVNGQDIFVYRTDSHYRVYLDQCTHQNVPLSDGYLVHDTLICRLHGAKYDLQTGNSLRAPACSNLTAYTNMIRDNILYIDCTGQPISYHRNRRSKKRRHINRLTKKQESFHDAK